ncbi:hypothetical protein ACFWBC_19930 [Streptomyces sp. NPDC059985]|uniref:hypothetical protein n=1 Tax=Streptomyces sp. NPDC059985 TaxID=3347025 RepID=UPI00369B3961
MDTTQPIKGAQVVCLHCGADVPQVSGQGRVKRYCTTWHGRLWRRRMAAYGWA